jgi:hypothetical protein
MEVLGVKDTYSLPKYETSELTRANTSMGAVRIDGMTVELRSKFSG